MTFALSGNKPRNYIVQPFFRFCGACQMSQIMLHKKNKIIPYKSIFSWIPGRIGFCNPVQLCSKWKQLWLNADLFSAWSIEKIRNNLKEWKISILLIAHAYDDNGFWFNFFKALFFQHYISIWWCDDKGFFVYDSSIKKNESCLSIWNIYIKNELLLRCWKRWWLWLYNNVFISID